MEVAISYYTKAKHEATTVDVQLKSSEKNVEFLT